jgi:geranylgeranyl diphosphate synthase type I
MTSLSTDPREASSAVEVRDRMLARVEERIETLLGEERGRWSAVNRRGAVLVDAVAALVEAGGKRLRPAFCLSGYLAAGGDPAENTVVDGAAALEFLHAFALLHDDVLDDSSARRPPMWSRPRSTGTRAGAASHAASARASRTSRVTWRTSTRTGSPG